MIEFFKQAFPLNRVVAFFGPLAASLAGIVSAWLADHLPFIADQVDSGELEAIFLGGTGAAALLFYKWLDGWQVHESRQWSEENSPPPPGE